MFKIFILGQVGDPVHDCPRRQQPNHVVLKYGINDQMSEIKDQTAIVKTVKAYSDSFFRGTITQGELLKEKTKKNRKKTRLEEILGPETVAEPRILTANVIFLTTIIVNQNSIKFVTKTTECFRAF